MQRVRNVIIACAARMYKAWDSTILGPAHEGERILKERATWAGRLNSGLTGSKPEGHSIGCGERKVRTW
eukprot:6210960-Pleurochrysis_carterae.AAC.1